MARASRAHSSSPRRAQIPRLVAGEGDQVEQVGLEAASGGHLRPIRNGHQGVIKERSRSGLERKTLTLVFHLTPSPAPVSLKWNTIIDIVTYLVDGTYRRWFWEVF